MVHFHTHGSLPRRHAAHVRGLELRAFYEVERRDAPPERMATVGSAQGGGIYANVGIGFATTAPGVKTVTPISGPPATLVTLDNTQVLSNHALAGDGGAGGAGAGGAGGAGAGGPAPIRLDGLSGAAEGGGVFAGSNLLGTDLAAPETIIATLEREFPDYRFSGFDYPGDRRGTFLAYLAKGAELRTLFLDAA